LRDGSPGSADYKQYKSKYQQQDDTAAAIIFLFFIIAVKIPPELVCTSGSPQIVDC